MTDYMKEIQKLYDEIQALRTIQTGGIWNNWTPTQTGWTALPTGQYRYCMVGKLVSCAIYMSAGTSNSTEATLTLPVPAAINSPLYVITAIHVVDNGVLQTNPGRLLVGSFEQKIYMNKTFGGAGFTASGNKMIGGSFTYEAA